MSERQKPFKLNNKPLGKMPESWGERRQHPGRHPPGAKIDWEGDFDGPMNRVAIGAAITTAVVAGFYILAQLFSASQTSGHPGEHPRQQQYK